MRTPILALAAATSTLAQWITLSSGLGFKDVEIGTGAVASLNSRVEVRLSMRAFAPNDSDFKRRSAGILSFGIDTSNTCIGRVPAVSCIAVGVRDMRVGGKRLLVLPAGFRERTVEVELVKVEANIGSAAPSIQVRSADPAPQSTSAENVRSAGQPVILQQGEPGNERCNIEKLPNLMLPTITGTCFGHTFALPQRSSRYNCLMTEAGHVFSVSDCLVDGSFLRTGQFAKIAQVQEAEKQVPAPTAAEVQKRSVLGLRLGMPEYEALRILKAGNPGIRFEQIYEHPETIVSPPVLNTDIPYLDGTKVESIQNNAKNKLLNRVADQTDKRKLIDWVRMGAAANFSSNSEFEEEIWYAVGDDNDKSIVDLQLITRYLKERPSVEAVVKKLTMTYGQPLPPDRGWQSGGKDNDKHLVWVVGQLPSPGSLSGSIFPHTMMKRTPFRNPSEASGWSYLDASVIADEHSLFVSSVVLRLTNARTWAILWQSRVKTCSAAIEDWKSKPTDEILAMYPEPPLPPVQLNPHDGRSIFAVTVGKPLPQLPMWWNSDSYRERYPMLIRSNSPTELNWGTKQIAVKPQLKFYPESGPLADMEVEVRNGNVEGIRIKNIKTADRGEVINYLKKQFGSKMDSQGSELLAVYGWNVPGLVVSYTVKSPDPPPQGPDLSSPSKALLALLSVFMPPPTEVSEESARACCGTVLVYRRDLLDQIKAYK